MSKYPFGPWSSSEGKIVNVGGYASSTGPTGGVMQEGWVVKRSGVNQGKDHRTPTAAMRQDDHQETVCGWGYDLRSKTMPYTVIPRWKNIAFSPGAAGGSFLPNISYSRPTQEVQDKAFQRFLERQSGAVNGLAVMGEFKSTAGTVARLANGITGVYNKHHHSLVKHLSKDLDNKKISFNSVRTLIKQVAKTNLEIQFGIKPLLGDLFGVMEAVNNSSLGLSHGLTVRGRYVHEETKSSRDTYNYSAVCLLKSRMLHREVCKWGATMTSEHVGGLASIYDRLGLTPYDLLPALWEVTPYSWLVDYLTNASDFFALASLRRGYFTNGYRVNIGETSWSSTCYPVSYPGYDVINQVEGKWVRKVFSFDRVPVDVDSYIPEFRFEVPSLAQSANALSVAAQKILKPVPFRGIKKLNRHEARRFNNALWDEMAHYHDF